MRLVSDDRPAQHEPDAFMGECQCLQCKSDHSVKTWRRDDLVNELTAIIDLRNFTFAECSLAERVMTAVEAARDMLAAEG